MFRSGYKGEARSPWPLLVVALLAFDVASAMRVKQRQDQTNLHSTLGDQMHNVIPGLGWGTTPLGQGFTTPLCIQRDTGEIGGVVTTPVVQSVRHHEKVYSTMADLRFGLAFLGAEGIGGSSLLKGATSLLSSFGGNLQKGHSIRHLQYYVPVVRHTITDLAMNCQTELVQEFQRISAQEDTKAINDFLHSHGSQVVHSVVLGGHLSIFELTDNKQIALGSVILNKKNTFEKLSELKKKADETVATFNSLETKAKKDAQDAAKAKADAEKANRALDLNTDSEQQGPLEYTAKKTSMIAEALAELSLVSAAAAKDADAEKNQAVLADQAARVSIGQAGSQLMSSSEQKTVLGGQWKIGKLGSAEMIKNWLETVQAGQNLAVLTRLSTPMYKLLPRELQKSVRGQIGVVRTQWEQRKAILSDELYFLSHQLHEKQDAYKSAVFGQTQVDALEVVVKTVPEYRKLCVEHSNSLNDGFVELHAIQPSRCMADYVHQLLWVCKAALPQMERYSAQKEGWVFAKADPSSVIDSSRQLCASERSHFESKDDDASNLMQASDILAPRSSPSTSRWSSTPGLGFGVLPVSNDFTVPLCTNPQKQQLSGLVATSPQEPLLPTVQVYRSNWELSALKSSDWISTSLASLLAPTSGRLGSGQTLVHATFSVPVSVQAMNDPAAKCGNSQLAGLEKMLTDGKLDDGTIDDFLVSHGTRVTNSVVLGGRLDVVSLQTQQAGSVGFLFMQDTVIHSSSSVDVSALGGKWGAGHESSMNASAPKSNLIDAVQRWVETVQNSTNNKVIAHTTLPITTLVSAKLRARMENRIKHATSGSMKRIFALESINYLRKRLKQARRNFKSSLRRSTQLGAFSKVVGNVGEFCEMTKEFSSKINGDGFRGISLSGDSSIAAYLDTYCRRTMIWTCRVALPKVKAKGSWWGTSVSAQKKRDALKAAAKLCGKQR